MLIPPTSLCALREWLIMRVEGEGVGVWTKVLSKDGGVRILLSMLCWGSGGLGCRC